MNQIMQFLKSNKNTLEKKQMHVLNGYQKVLEHYIIKMWNFGKMT